MLTFRRGDSTGSRMQTRAALSTPMQKTIKELLDNGEAEKKTGYGKRKHALENKLHFTIWDWDNTEVEAPAVSESDTRIWQWNGHGYLLENGELQDTTQNVNIAVYFYNRTKTSLRKGKGKEKDDAWKNGENINQCTKTASALCHGTGQR